MFVLPPVAVLQPPKPVEGPTKRQGNLAEKNKNRRIFVGGLLRDEKIRIVWVGKTRKQQGGGLDNVRTFLSLFVVLLPDHCIHQLEAGSRCSDSLQKQRTEPVEEERYSPLSTATRNEPIPKPEGKKKTT